MRVPLTVPDLRGNEAAYLAQCVADNWISSAGPFVNRLEEIIAAEAGCRYGVATVNGTTALELVLVSAGIGAGSKVVLPDWTFAATVNAVIHAGATPVFVDVTAESWTLDPTLVAEAVRREGASAVVAVHASGHPPDMDILAQICSDAGVPLYEDAAGAIGSRYRGRPAGGLGDAAIFSFNGNKLVTAGGGGAIVTDNETLARKAHHLSAQARASADYRVDAAGYNYRMTNLNAAVALAQLERLDEMLAAKRAIAARYDSVVGERDDLSAMPRCAWADSNCWLYNLLCASEDDARSLVAHMASRDVEARVFWRTLADQPPYVAYPRLRRGVASRLSGSVVTLPCSSRLTAAEQDQVIAALSGWAGQPLAAAA
ncbi:MAG: pyridoxal-5'-phosphate-dependent protein [Rhodospirillaceae bacterium]|nr:pyridoxal-5'-phosphate-dependent protein [Rhodospirillaceae bacterium]